MEQNNNGSAFSTASFKVKYRTVELQTAPAYTATTLGTLKRGAVVTVLEDVSRYFCRVRLANGLEGYLYRPAGEVVSNLTPTHLPALETALPFNGAVSVVDRDGAVGKSKLNGYTNNSAAVHTSHSAEPSPTVFSNLSQARSSSHHQALVITSGEIAALDSPGIVGRQVAKLRRGDTVNVVSENSFFYQVTLPNGGVGYIPRYAAAPRH